MASWRRWKACANISPDFLEELVVDLLVIGTIRDIVLIVFFGLGTLLVVILILIAFLLYRKMGGLLDALKGNLENTRVTLGNVAASSTMITDAVIRPLIKGWAVAAGAKKAFSFLSKFSAK